MPETALIGYSADCVITGTVELAEGRRLTDLLNEVEFLAVEDCRLYALDDGRVVEAGSVTMNLDELFAVEAPPGSSDSRHRVRTRAQRVQFEIGPLEVLGHVHAPTTGDPIAGMARRKSMVPLTEATLALSYAGRHHMRDVPVLIVNRDRAQVIEAVAYESSKIDTMFIPKFDPRARDLTDEIYGGPGDVRL